MYNILDYIIQNNLRIRFGFIHVPYNYNRRKAIVIVKAIINNFKS
jgi:pyrrolidone-carboxylate peptidase